MNKAGIIGRFNPLCQNHVDLFRQALKGNDELLIGVGQKNLVRAKEIYTNPEEVALYELNYLFPFEQTKELIETVLPKDTVTVVPIPDIFNTNQYAAHVQDCFEKQGKNFRDITLFGENPDTYNCFRGYDIEIAKDTLGFHATDVRQEILLYGNSNRTAVPLTREQREIIIDAEREKKRLQFIVKALTENDTRDEAIRHDGFNKILTYPTPEGYSREVLLTRDAVAVLYVDPQKHIWLNKQYRSAKNKVTLGVPAGMADKKGVCDLELAVEELAEEQGILVETSQLQFLGKYGASQGQVTEEVSLFLATGPAKYVGQQLDEGEESIEVVQMPLQEALKQPYNYDCWRLPLLLAYANSNR